MIQKPVKNCNGEYILTGLFTEFDRLNGGRIYYPSHFSENYLEEIIKRKMECRLKKLKKIK